MMDLDTRTDSSPEGNESTTLPINPLYDQFNEKTLSPVEPVWNESSGAELELNRDESEDLLAVGNVPIMTQICKS